MSRWLIHAFVSGPIETKKYSVDLCELEREDCQQLLITPQPMKLVCRAHSLGKQTIGWLRWRSIAAE
jgi:hypothetical protein